MRSQRQIGARIQLRRHVRRPVGHRLFAPNPHLPTAGRSDRRQTRDAEPQAVRRRFQPNATHASSLRYWLQRCFSGMPLTPVPTYWVKMSPKTFEMATRYNRQTTPAELECSVAGFIFTNIQKYCPGARFSKLLKKILGKSYEKLTTNL